MLLHQLEIFAAVYEQRHFTRASRQLYISQSGVSQSIHKLEEELDVRLFERNGREILPTKEADLLYQHVRKMLDEWKSALNELPGRSQEVRLYYYIRSVQKEKNFLLAKLLREMPDLVISQKPLELNLLMKNEEWEEGCLYLIPEEFVTSGNIRKIKLGEGHHCLIMNENNLLAKKEAVELTDLQGQPLFLPQKFRFRHISKALEALEMAGISYDVNGYAMGSEVIPKLLAFGGAAIMPDYMAESQPGIVIRPFHDGVSIPIYLACYGKQTPAIQKIWRFLDGSGS